MRITHGLQPNNFLTKKQRKRQQTNRIFYQMTLTMKSAFQGA
jgi:hypothetical protein